MMEIEELKQKVINRFAKNYGDQIYQHLDLYDWDAKLDSTLTVEENYNIIDKEFSLLLDQVIGKPWPERDEYYKQKGIDQAREQARANDNEFAEENLYKAQLNTIIVGKKGSAKTVWAWSFAEKTARMSKRKLYVFEHPRPELLKTMPFEVRNITRIDAMFNITDGVIILDEAHEKFNVLDKRVNEDLKILLSRSRQNNTCFIFVCHNSYFVNRSLFSFIDVRVIKEVNEKHWELERPHMKKLYEDIHIFGKDGFYIDSDYVKGYKTFQKPEWWKEEYSNAYRTMTSKDNFFA